MTGGLPGLLPFGAMFLTGTLLNAIAVVIGTTAGVLVGERLSERLRTSLTDVLGLFVVLIGVNLALRLFGDPALGAGDDLAVLGALVVGVICGNLLRLTERLDALGAWFQRRLSTPDRPSRVAEAFVTASLVFCVGPLTILGSIQNGLSGDVQLLAVKSLLDGVASMAFAAALGFGVYLSALTILVVQGGIASAAWLLGTGLDPASVAAISAAGGVLLMGTGLRLLAIRQIAVADMLPALLLAPLFVALAAAIRGWLAG
jgi:uncharacterized membrane protein YqgA involved in biofilm formation